MDKYTIEVFANDGKQAMTTLIYTDLKSQGIVFSSDGKATFQRDTAYNCHAGIVLLSCRISIPMINSYNMQRSEIKENRSESTI